MPTVACRRVHRAQCRSRRAPAHRRERVVRTERVAVERLAQELLDDVGQVAVLEALSRAFDLDQVWRELDELGADAANRGAQESRLVAGRAAKQQARVLRARFREHVERRSRHCEKLRMNAAMRALARDRLRQLEAFVLVYINRHGLGLFWPV